MRDSRLSPVRSSPSVMMGVQGMAGLSSHRALKRSGTGTMMADGTFSCNSSMALTLWQSPSTAMRGSSISNDAIHSGMGTCSGTRIL